jgi:hypothetical protein
MVVCPFVLILLAIVLSVLLRYTVSDCPFGIFKLFFIPAFCEVRVAQYNGIVKMIRTQTFDYKKTTYTSID